MHRTLLRKRQTFLHSPFSTSITSRKQHEPFVTSAITSNPWQVCIGIEIHAQLLTQTKLFSGASTTFQTTAPNTQVSLFDAAIPGTLPVLNEECVNQAIRSALSFKATVHHKSKFERKHYFYADMPLGYQVTQQDACIATNGRLNITVPKTRDNSKRFDVYKRDIRICRLQLEQDSGKSIHDFDPKLSMIDLNRAGCALIEIVSEPDIRSSDEAACYVRKIQNYLRTVGSCNGNMEEGSLRCDVNISVRPMPLTEEELSNSTITMRDSNSTTTTANNASTYPLGERVEVKNLNSVKSVIRAIDYEVDRQINNVEINDSPVTKHETRTFDVSQGITVRLRSKENAPDYRFLLDPDLPPLIVQQKRIDELLIDLPELPDAICQRLMLEYHLSLYDANVLVEEPNATEYYENVIHMLTATNDVSMHSKDSQDTKDTPDTLDTEDKQDKQDTASLNYSLEDLSKITLNWITNELLGRMRPNNMKFIHLGQKNTSWHGLKPNDIALLITAIIKGDISGKIAKNALDIVFDEMQQQDTKNEKKNGNIKNGSSLSPMDVIEREGWKVVSDVNVLVKYCNDVIRNPKHQQQVNDVRSGEKPKLIGFFVGQVMKLSKGQADPKKVQKLLQELLLK